MRASSAATGRRGERRFGGLAVSGGIAIGRAHLVERAIGQVPQYRIAANAADGEIARLEDAVETSRRQARTLLTEAETLHGARAGDLSYLIDAHLHMLSGSRLIRGVSARIAEQRLNAEAAVSAELKQIAEDFAVIADPYIAARIEDIRDVGLRLIRNLMKAPYRAFSAVAKGSIVIADQLSPADIALMDPSIIRGFAATLGGRESHTAIMARALGLPAVLGAGELIGAVRARDIVIIDGDEGLITVNPDDTTLAGYRRTHAANRRRRRALRSLKDRPAITRDGVAISLQANVELPGELDTVDAVGAEGIGLLRSEFLFMNRDDLPSEDEQYRAFRAAVESMGKRPVTVRTLDIGGDKLGGQLGRHFADSANPALGLRAIRLSLRVDHLLTTPVAAMLRASAHGHLRILLPLITTAGEVRQVRRIVRRIAARLVEQGVKIADPPPRLGAMIEVPGAALAAESIAAVSDFLSIGTNDLTMYTLATDRGDERVAHLYDPLHPAVLRLIKATIDAAARANTPLNLCGEMAGEPQYTALLLGLGLRELSMSPAGLPGVKRRLRALDVAEAARRAEHMLAQTDGGRIAALLDDFNALS